MVDETGNEEEILEGYRWADLKDKEGVPLSNFYRMPSFGKRNPFTEKHFEAFETAYTASDRTKVKDERFSYVPLQEISDKKYSLDLGLIADESITKAEDIGEPKEIVSNVLSELEQITKGLQTILKEL